MNRPRPAALRQTWLIVFGALVVSVFSYGLLCYLIEHSPNPRQVNAASVATMRPILIGMGIAALVASVGWLRFTIDGKIGDGGRDLALSPGQFQTKSIVALALSEACCIFGLLLFFMGAPMKEFAIFALGTLFIDLAFILPRGLQFWAAYEKNSHT